MLFDNCCCRNYHSDPIVFSCSLKHLETSQALSSKHPSFFLRVEVSTDYPVEVIECSIQPVVDSTRALIGESNSATSMEDVEDNKDGGKTNITSVTERRAVLSKLFNSSLNLTSSCSFSQALNNFYTFQEPEFSSSHGNPKICLEFVKLLACRTNKW